MLLWWYVISLSSISGRGNGKKLPNVLSMQYDSNTQTSTWHVTPGIPLTLKWEGVDLNNDYIVFEPNSLTNSGIQVYTILGEE